MTTWGHSTTAHLTYEQVLYEASRLTAHGRVGDYASYNLVGEFSALGATRVDLQDQGGIQVRPVSAAAVSLVSSSPDDSVVGPGVREVMVEGLGPGFISGTRGPWLTEVVQMNGTSAVLTNSLFLRVNSIVAVEAGSVGVVKGNVGTIDASVGGVLQVRMSVEAEGYGTGRSRNSNTTIPADWWGLTQEAHVGWAGNNPASLFFGISSGSRTIWPVSNQIAETTGIKLGLFPHPPRTRIFAQASRLVGGNTEPLEVTTAVALIRLES